MVIIAKAIVKPIRNYQIRMGVQMDKMEIWEKQTIK